MKKMFLAAMAALLIICLVIPRPSESAESIVQSIESYRDRVSIGHIWTVTWTAATNGSLTATAMEAAYIATLRGTSLCFVIVNPGDTAPQTLYDITLVDQDGIDMLGGALADLSATVSGQFIPKLNASIWGCRPFNGTATFTLTGNNVNSANGVVRFYFSQ